MEYLLDESDRQKFLQLSANRPDLSSSKRRRRCFTAMELGRISRECSATSLGMPGMSEGRHAKISALAWRKSMSTTSYLLSRVALTCNALSLV